MANDLILSGNDNSGTTKSFWLKKEGMVGIAFLGFCGWLLSKALPFIIVLLQNTLYTIFLALVLFGILYLLMDRQFRVSVSYIYKMAMRKITGVIWDMDPVSVLKTYINDMEKSRDEMNKQITNLNGQMRSLQGTITRNQQKQESNMVRANKAQELGKTADLFLSTRKAGRAQKSNMTLQALYTKLEVLYRSLGKMYEVSEVLIEDTKDEVESKEIEQKALRAGTNAIRSAMKIYKGDPDKKFIFDQAMESLVDDIAAKKGEIDRFMELSEKVISGVDLDNAVFEEEGFKLLEKWQKESSLLLGNQKPILIAQAEDHSQVLNLNSPIAQPMPVRAERKKNPYSDLLTQK